MPASSDSGTGAGGKRRRARSGTGTGTGTGAGTGAGAGPSSQPRIGRRVIEVCRRHRCEDHDYEGGGAGGAAASAAAAAAWTDAALAALYSGRPTAFASGAYVRAAVGRVGDRCSRKLEKIEGVLERLEEDHSAALDRAASPGGGDDGSGDGSGSGAMAKLAADGEDLCTMYRSFLGGTFCPHSLSMLDWGRGGRKSELILCCWACPAPQCFPFLGFGPPPPPARASYPCLPVLIRSFLLLVILIVVLLLPSFPAVAAQFSGGSTSSCGTFPPRPSSRRCSAPAAAGTGTMPPPPWRQTSRAPSPF